MRIAEIVIFPLAILMLLVGDVFGAHGLSIDGKLKYQENFEKFEYVSSDSKKGGTLILHSTGSFDKMNPFTLKGTPPDGLLQYVFEPLAVDSLDEPFAQYGLIAKDMDVAEDKMSVTFTLNENARFSDGSPITAEDVEYTVKMLKSSSVHPLYPYYYADIKDSEIIDPLKIKVNFKKVNRELPIIASQIQVMSKKFYINAGFEGKEMKKPIGSGPYIVESFNLGKSIIYKRNPQYWASKHHVRKGMYNFDRIIIKYYKDPVVAIEAFKAGEFDLMSVNVAKQWVRDLTGEKIDNGEIVKIKFPHGNNAGLQGFVMNTRRDLFDDPVVRKALGLAFDFNWSNQKIFYNQYQRNNSFFSNSYLAASGLPSASELELLQPFKDILPNEVFVEPMGTLDDMPGVTFRGNLKKAAELLKKRGWVLKDGILHNALGREFSFEILLVNQVFEKVMAGYVNNLKRIGVKATYRTIDPTLYTERINDFDFDMCVFMYGQSLSPGNEQKNFWHSESADQKGSRNLAGIKNTVVDSLIEKIIYASNKESLTVACKALDRVLWYGYYLVPNWYLNGHRLAFHDKFNRPEKLPIYYDYNSLIMTWWAK